MHRLNRCHFNEEGKNSPFGKYSKRGDFYVRYAFMITLNRLFNCIEVESIKEELKVADFLAFSALIYL